MSQSYEFRDSTLFTVGTVGAPGERVFYLQVGDPFDIVSVKLEKQQVQALAQFLEGLLADLPAPVEPLPVTNFREPLEPDWTVGQIAVGVDEQGTGSQLVVVIEEFTPELAEELLELEDALEKGLDASDDTEEDRDVFDILDLGESSGATVRIQISIEQAAAFLARTNELMTKGRPPCRLCGLPLDPVGHFCPRLN